MDASKPQALTLNQSDLTNKERIRAFFDKISKTLESDTAPDQETWKTIQTRLFKEGKAAELFCFIGQTASTNKNPGEIKSAIEEQLLPFGLSYDDLYSELIVFTKKLEDLLQRVEVEEDAQESPLKVLHDQMVKLKIAFNPTLAWILVDPDDRNAFQQQNQILYELFDFLFNPENTKAEIKRELHERGTTLVGLKDTFEEMQQYLIFDPWEINLDQAITVLHEMILQEKHTSVVFFQSAELTDNPAMYVYDHAIHDAIIDRVSLLVTQSYFAQRSDDSDDSYFGEEWKTFALRYFRENFDEKGKRSFEYQSLATTEHIDSLDWVVTFMNQDDAEKEFNTWSLKDENVTKIYQYFDMYHRYITFYNESQDLRLAKPRNLSPKELAIKKLLLQKRTQPLQEKLDQLEELLNQFRYYLPIKPVMFKTIKRLRSQIHSMIDTFTDDHEEAIADLKNGIDTLSEEASTLWRRADRISSRKSQTEQECYRTNTEKCITLLEQADQLSRSNPLQQHFQIATDFFQSDSMEQSLLLAQCILHHEKSHFGELYFDSDRLLERVFSGNFQDASGAFHPVFLQIAQSLYTKNPLDQNDLIALQNRIKDIFDISKPLGADPSLETEGVARRNLVKTYLSKAAALQQRKRTLPVLYGKSQKTFKQKEREHSYDPVLLMMIDKQIQDYVDSFYYLSWKKTQNEEQIRVFYNNLNAFLASRTAWLDNSGLRDHSLHPSIRLKTDFRDFALKYEYSKDERSFKLEKRVPKWTPDSLEGCYYRLNDLLLSLQILYRMIVSKLPYLSDCASSPLLVPHQTRFSVSYPKKEDYAQCLQTFKKKR